MTSSDRDILVRIYENQGRMMLRLDSLEAGQRVIVRRLDNVENRLDNVEHRLSNVETELQSQREELNSMRTDLTEFKTQTGTQFNGLFMEQRLLREKTEMLQHSTNLVLGAIAVFATVLGALPAIREWLRTPRVSTDAELDEIARRVSQRLINTPSR